MTAGAVLNGRAGRKNYKLVPCSKKKVSGESSLPDELIFEILVSLPAHVLYNSTRYVCRQWYKIIHNPLFCKEQLLHSSTGLLLQDRHVPHIAQFAEFGEMSATPTDIKFMFPSRVLSTCNGLVLFRNPHDPSTLHLANPLTKQTDNFSTGLIVEKSLLLLWMWKLFNEFPSPAVLTLRSHTSIFYLQRGRTLSCSLMTECRSLMDVLVLSDPISGEWRMLYKIDFGAQKHLSTGMNHASFPPSRDEAPFFFPTAWVNEGDVLVLYISRPSGYSGSYFAFNVKTGNFFKVGSKDYCIFDVCRGYAHSLDSPTPTEVTIHK
ncbi:hypothetical protein RHMOL_Rhmol05G0262400 [Rhododendron molle]|uniref:Uncharacterized protein n=1 Tax=Rhododendron molle TaxID=49168 RepID=A0ACC0NVM9_RHOML|nr:hypothetical protein RHMOL_Rhmol05G0262400 [Rhododendron molle]